MKPFIVKVFFLSVWGFISFFGLIPDQALSSPLGEMPQVIAQDVSSTPPLVNPPSFDPSGATDSGSSRPVRQGMPQTQPTAKDEAGNRQNATEQGAPLPEPATQQQKQSTRSASPYDMEAIKDFNRALYGS